MELAAGFDPCGDPLGQSSAPGSKRGSRTKRGPLTLLEKDHPSADLTSSTPKRETLNVDSGGPECPVQEVGDLFMLEPIVGRHHVAMLALLVGVGIVAIGVGGSSPRWKHFGRTGSSRPARGLGRAG